jgi:hypothetical protein
MSLKTTKKSNVWVVAFVALGLVAIACGDDGDDDEDAGGTTAGMGGTGGTTGGSMGGNEEPYVADGTLVPVTASDTSAPLPAVHKIELLNAADGQPLSPPLSTTSESGTGKWKIEGVPAAARVAIHVEGAGDAATGTYDTVILNVYKDIPDDPLTRVSSAGTATIAEGSAGYTAKAEAAALSGAIYIVQNKMRVGAVGCAKIYVDDKPSPATEYDQRYIDGNSLPTTLDKQGQTLRSGRFFFGNLAKGKHTLKWSLDNGATFVGDPVEVFIGKGRMDASSAFKAILYQVGIDYIPPDGKNPTPASCPM